MSSAIYTDRADVTARQPAISVGGDWRMTWACGHKARREPGAVVRGSFLLRCAACAKARPAAVCADTAAAVGTSTNEGTR